MPSPSTMVVDDLHPLHRDTQNGFGSLLKRLSDQAFQESDPAKVLLLDIPTTVTALLEDANNLGPRLGSYLFKGASDTETNKLLDEG